MDKVSKLEKSLTTKRLLKFYILPFVSISSFILIIIFLVIPKVSDIFGSLDQITALSSQLQQKTTTLSGLNELSKNSSLILAQLNIINKTSPTGNTEVVAFRDKITKLIQDNSLNIVSQSLSESDINKNAKDINSIGLSLLEIPFNFEINGNYQNMLGFIDDLSAIDDFVIVREMELSSRISSNNNQITTLKLRIDKYQFSIADQELLNAQYSQVPIDSKINNVVLQYIESKSL